MRGPSRRPRSTRWLVLGTAGMLAGCSVVPGSRLDECRRLSQTLQADNARLKDSLLSQRSQYEDLAQRADDDARRLKVQDDEIQRLLSSIQAYQDERDKLATSYERIKGQVQAASNPRSAALLESFGTLAKAHPGCEFDPTAGVLTVASDPLFEPGTDRLKPEARPLLDAIAARLGTPEGRALRILVAGHTDGSPIRRTALRDDPPRGGHLSLDRATRIRDVLEAAAKLDAARFEVAGFEATRPREEGPDETSRARNRRIEIRLIPDAATATAPTAVGDGP